MKNPLMPKKPVIKPGLKAIKKAFGAREVTVFGGLGLFGYGLYQYSDWLSLTVSGGLLMLIGLGWLDINNYRGLNGSAFTDKQRDQGR